MLPRAAGAVGTPNRRSCILPVVQLGYEGVVDNLECAVRQFTAVASN